MNKGESNYFLQTMKEKDIVKKEGKIFGFETIRLKQKWSLFKCRKRQPDTVEESEYQINDQINLYQQLSLLKCYVNIFALKKFIKNNIKSLRIIEIEECYFYLSDEDAKNKRYQIKNQRMFQELKFDWLIEQFKFKNIQTITIKLSKDADNSNLSKSTKVGMQIQPKNTDRRTKRKFEQDKEQIQIEEQLIQKFDKQ